MIDLLLSIIFPLIWIYYFLKKDKHPEPFIWLAFTFILGILAAVLSYFTEDIFVNWLNDTQFLIFSSFIEEFFKFLVVWSIIFPQRVFNEPIDAMIYMMVSALGFASIENFFYLLRSENSLLVLFIRFLGANLLHILASGIIGYGYAYYKNFKRILPFIIAFIAASVLHFLYNFAIISKELGFILILPVLWSVVFIILAELDYLNFINERRKK